MAATSGSSAAHCDQRANWEREQEEMRRELVLEDDAGLTRIADGNGPALVAGLDISFIKGNGVDACACAVLYDVRKCEVVHSAVEMVRLDLPYISGFLGFREVPHFVHVLERCEAEAGARADVLMVDGNGVLHPRGFGSACHLGVATGRPAIGIAKNFLFVDGLTRDDVDALAARSACEPIVGASGRELGFAFRAKEAQKRPVYVSAGHRVSNRLAAALVRLCSIHKVPEPIRWADFLSREHLRGVEAVYKDPDCSLCGGVRPAAPTRPAEK